MKGIRSKKDSPDWRVDNERPIKDTIKELCIVNSSQIGKLGDYLESTNKEKHF